MRLINLMLFVLFLVMACTPKGTQKSLDTRSQEELAQPTIQNINTDQFKELMKEENIVILDVRTPGEVTAGKIDGALEINVNGSDFDTQIQSLDKDKTYLVYCKAGSRSARACRKMEAEGFKSLYNLEGGYDAWRANY